MPAKRKKSANPKNSRLRQISPKMNELLYKTLIENVHLGITLIDTNHRIVTTNIGQGRIFKKPHSKFAGKYCFKEFEKRSKVCSHCPGIRTMATGRPAEAEAEGVRDDGSHISAHLRTFPVFKSDGSISGFIEIVEDVSKYKRTEESLKESEERFGAVFDNAPVGILLADAKTKKFYLGNKTICKMLGCRPDEIKNMAVSDIHPRKHLPHVLEQFKKLAIKKIELAEDVPVRRKDGSIFYADINSFPIVLDGKAYLAGIFRDITERKKAEEKIRQAETKYRTLVEQIPAVTYISALDKASTTIYVSPQIQQFFGFSHQQYHVDHDLWLKQLHPDDRNRVLESLHQSKKSRQPFNCEYRMLSKDARVVWCRDEAVIVRDSSGKPLVLQGIMFDITAQKQAEEKLKESEERFKAIFDNAPVGILLTDLKTKKFYLGNKAICQMLGYRPEEIKNLTVLDTTPKELSSYAIEQFEKVARGETSLVGGGDVPIKRKDGSVFYAAISAFPITFGGKTCITGIFRDITEHKKAREELQQAEAKYRTLVEQIPAVTYTAVLDKASTTTYVSPQIAKFIGYPSKEYKANPDLWRKRLHPEDRQRVLDCLYQSHKSNNPFVCEYRMLNKNGKVVWCRDEAVIVKDSSGKPLMMQGVMFDITAQKRAEEELNTYREKMARAERLASLGTLSATVAHELNQPLTVIRLSIENSLDDLKSASCPKEILDTLRDGLNEVSNATSVVDRFRNYARQSSRKNLCATNLGAIAGRIIHLLGKTAQRAKMTLHLKGLDKLPPVYSNEKDLEQMFFALTENAIHAADGKKSHRLTVSGGVKGNCVELRFADNCSGIAPENLDKIFDPFFTTGSDDGRTGLGLSIVQRIVSGYEGKIRVRSLHGKGTTFYITLPIHSETVG